MAQCGVHPEDAGMCLGARSYDNRKRNRGYTSRRERLKRGSKTRFEKKPTILSNNIKQALHKWEFGKSSKKRNLEILLATLHTVLPNRIMLKWIKSKSGLLVDPDPFMNEDYLTTVYPKAAALVNPDVSMQRGDSEETQLICKNIFEILEKAYYKHMNWIHMSDYY